MKINYLFGILGFIFGIFGAIIAYALSGISSSLITNGSIALISGIIGLGGIWLFNKDYKISGIQYILGGIGVLIGVSAFGIIGFIFYLIAGILSFIEKDKSEQTSHVSTNTGDNVHYFGNKEDIQPPVITKNDKKLWLVPLISLIIIILVGVAGNTSHNMELTENSNSLNISNISISSEGYSMYKVSCDLTPTKQFSYLQMEVIFYDSNNAVIGKSPLVWNTNNPSKDQLIKVSGIATTNNQNAKPKRAEIYFYDSVASTNPSEAIYSQNITIN